MVLGKRAASPIGSIINSVTGDKKDTYFKMAISDLFYGDWKKFKVYYTQIRFYLWNDFKRILKALKTLSE
jgi:hypothetical protein